MLGTYGRATNVRIVLILIAMCAALIHAQVDGCQSVALSLGLAYWGKEVSSPGSVTWLEDK